MKTTPLLSQGLFLLLSITTMTCYSEPSNKNEPPSWTTYEKIQANDPEITRRYQRGNDNKSTQIIVPNNAFRDNGILPYTKLRNAKELDKTISITSTAGEYEPASFVIQSGNQQLRNVETVVSDLTNKAKSSIISSSTIRELKVVGITPLAYGLPHAEEEKLATTIKAYGFDLVSKGFSGAIPYAYQSGQCWDDWMQWKKSNYRPNLMAYPTIGKPIPTLQWETWREGVDDLKYLTTYAKLSGKSPVQALNDAASRNIISPEAIGSYLIEQTLDLSNQYSDS